MLSRRGPFARQVRRRTAPSQPTPGIFTTVLGAYSTDDLARALKRVVDSLAAPSANRYAAARSLDSSSWSMAVLIQSQVTPRAAGVAFARDPLTGADYVGIEANYGLGASVVDGSVTPDYFKVARSGHVAHRERGSKREQLLMVSQRLVRLAVPSRARCQLAIDDADAIQIARLAWRLESDLNAPQDLEWALSADTLFLLQARPITTGQRVP